MWQDERWVTPPGQTSSTGSFSWPARGSSRSWRSQTCQRSWEGSVSAGETLGNLDNWGEGENRRAEMSFAESWVKSGAEIEQIEDRCHFGHFSAGLSSPDTIRRTIREGGHLKHYLCWWSCICSTIQPHWGESLHEELIHKKLKTCQLTKLAKGNTALSLIHPVLTGQPPRILRER